MDLMELEYLKKFSVLAKTLSFSRTAERLFTTQSTISKHLRSLEAELAFVWNPNPVLPLVPELITNVSLTSKKDRLLSSAALHFIHCVEQTKRC